MKKALKRNNLVEGAAIATAGIIITKLLGLLYVIPFNYFVGEKGGSLYGYAYNIYLFFVGISSAGIPFAISKVVSEYQTLGNEDAKERAFSLGKWLSIGLGLICFIALFWYAPYYAKQIIGDAVGGNTVEDITFVIRMISTAILFVPILSVYRGYFEGHKFITSTAYSEVLEQIVRVSIIIFGSYFLLSVFHLSIRFTIGIAVFAATIGAFIAFLYLFIKEKKSHNLFQIENKNGDNKVIHNREIIRKILVYAIPFIMIDMFKSLYNVVDSVTVVRTLSSYYVTDVAEGIYSVISTWGAKFNMIIVSFSTGMMISLIPNLTSSLVLKDKNDIQDKVNKSIQLIALVTIPLTVGLSFLAEPVYTLFYGYSMYGPSIMKLFVFVALISAFYLTFLTIVQVLKMYKTVFLSLACGLLFKTVTNVFFIQHMVTIGLPNYYGPILSTMIGFMITIIICGISLNKKYDIHYQEIFRITGYSIIGSFIMFIVLYVISNFIPVVSSNRILNLPIACFYGIVGMILYFLFSYQTGCIQKVLGDHFFDIIKKKFKRLK